MRALRKLVASVSAEEGTPGGSASTRFSTWPSSPTSTTSARSGSSRTNSMCFSRELDFAVSTTAAARVRPDSRVRASPSAASTDCARPTEASWLWIDCRSALGEIADLHQGIDEKAQAEFGRQPAGRGMRRIDQAELLEIRHHVAHRGRRQRHRDQARDVARADGFAGRQIALDDLTKNVARTLVELGEPGMRRDQADRIVVGHTLLPHNCL